MEREQNFNYLPRAITDLVKNRQVIPDVELLSLYRELEAITRLLGIEIFCDNPRRSKELRNIALSQRVNYLQTPEATYGLLPPVEISLKLSCYQKKELNKNDQIII